MNREPSWWKLAPPEWRPLLNGIRRHRRPLAAGVYALAGLQREYAEARLHTWPPPEPLETIDLRVLTLACERDRVLLFRMISSFLTYVGLPRSITVISDGSLTTTTAAALRRLSPCIRLGDRDAVTSAEAVPEVVARFASNHVLGLKVALCLASETRGPHLLVDSDVEFFAGATRMRDLVDQLGDRPRFMQHERLVRGIGSPNTHDPRLVEGREVLPRVNSGVILWRRPLAWESAIAGLDRVADNPVPLSEQTVFAITLTESNGLPLPSNEYVLTTEDGGRPWDRFGRRDVALRHYFSIGLQWKMFLKGGPRGGRTIPAALFRGLARRVRRETTWAWH